MRRVLSGYVFHSRHADMAACQAAKEQLLKMLDENNDGRQEHASGQLAMGRGDGTYERLLYAEPLCRVTGEDPNAVPQSREPRPPSGQPTHPVPGGTK
jgi:hypothetical protein